MGIKSVKKQNIVDIVYEQMKANILEGVWGAGTKLPSEPEMAASFDVSRVSIRSAVQKLRDLGVAVTYQGKGTFISEELNPNLLLRDNIAPIMHLSKEEFLDMMVFRQTVEFKCMELAVQNATDEDIKMLEQALSNMLMNKDNYKKYSEADFEFHLAIVKASQNSVFYNVMCSIKDIYYYYLEELNRVLGITLESVEAHLKVFLAIKNRDASTAMTVLNEAMADNVEAINRLQKELASETAANND